MPLGCEPPVCFRACQRAVLIPPAGTRYSNGLGRSSSRPPGCEHALGLRDFCFLSRLPAGWYPASSIHYFNGLGRGSNRSPGCGHALGLRACFCVRASERHGSPPTGSHYFNGLGRSSSRPWIPAYPWGGALLFATQPVSGMVARQRAVFFLVCNGLGRG